MHSTLGWLDQEAVPAAEGAALVQSRFEAKARRVTP